MKTLRTISLLLLLAGISLSYAQQMNQKIEMQLDPMGNADLNISMKMNATNWQNWVQTLGNNPAALKRAIEREMPAYFLDDFKLEKNDMERSFQLSLKAYGVCKVDKKGKWILETDAKDIEITELTARKYMFVNSPAELGGQIQQTTMVEFPEAASQIEIDKDAFGKTVFEFDMENTGGSINWLRWAGIALLLGGLIWGVLQMVMTPKALA